MMNYTLHASNVIEIDESLKLPLTSSIVEAISNTHIPILSDNSTVNNFLREVYENGCDSILLSITKTSNENSISQISDRSMNLKSIYRLISLATVISYFCEKHIASIEQLAGLSINKTNTKIMCETYEAELVKFHKTPLEALADRSTDYICLTSLNRMHELINSIKYKLPIIYFNDVPHNLLTQQNPVTATHIIPTKLILFLMNAKLSDKNGKIREFCNSISTKLVSDLMTTKVINKFNDSTSFLTCVKEFGTTNAISYPVEDEETNLMQFVISRTDIGRLLYNHLLIVSSVEELLSSGLVILIGHIRQKLDGVKSKYPLIICDKSCTIMHAIQKMEKAHVRNLYITDNSNRIQSRLSYNDLGQILANIIVE